MNSSSSYIYLTVLCTYIFAPAICSARESFSSVNWQLLFMFIVPQSWFLCTLFNLLYIIFCSCGFCIYSSNLSTVFKTLYSTSYWTLVDISYVQNLYIFLLKLTPTFIIQVNVTSHCSLQKIGALPSFLLFLTSTYLISVQYGCFCY